MKARELCFSLYASSWWRAYVGTVRRKIVNIKLSASAQVMEARKKALRMFCAVFVTGWAGPWVHGLGRPMGWAGPHLTELHGLWMGLDWVDFKRSELIQSQMYNIVYFFSIE